MAERAVVFVDGNNWYHSLRSVGVNGIGQLDFAKVSCKLAQHRRWTGTRYYVGRVLRSGTSRLYADQRRFLARLTSSDRRISAHLGRLESRTQRSAAALALIDYLNRLLVRIDARVFRDLMAIAKEHAAVDIVVEKAVDVMLAVDMVVLAERDGFDTAYLLSADGDFTPAVEAVRACGKTVFAVSASHGARLRQACNAFIRIDRAWLDDCRSPPR